jgi:predicted DNA-binding protein YlxM (UPF0122 family)
MKAKYGTGQSRSIANSRTQAIIIDVLNTKSLTETAKRFGTSRETVRQILARSLRVLRSYTKKENMSSDMQFIKNNAEPLRDEFDKLFSDPMKWKANW